MKTLLVALPADWERRLREVLARRGHSPVLLRRLDGEGDIVQNGEAAIVVLHADGSGDDALRFCRRLRDRNPTSKLQVLTCVSAPPNKETWPLFRARA